MNTPKTISLEGNANNELMGQISQTFRLTILISLCVVFSTLFIFWWFKHRQHRLRHRGECLLLCGISNSGKTILFNRLTSHIEKKKFYSMPINHGIMTLDYLPSDRPIKKVHVIEIPSNLRFRQYDFNAYKNSAKGIIFVIDSSTIEKEIKHVSDYLYNILREKTFRDRHLPLLIFCNKQDLNKKDQNLQTICHLIEHELTIKRQTYISSSNLHEENNELNSDDIGRLGKETFEFNDIKDIQIEFVEGSVLNIRKTTNDKPCQDEEINGNVHNFFRVHQWIARIWFN